MRDALNAYVLFPLIGLLALGWPFLLLPQPLLDAFPWFGLVLVVTWIPSVFLWVVVLRTLLYAVPIRTFARAQGWRFALVRQAPFYRPVAEGTFEGRRVRVTYDGLGNDDVVVELELPDPAPASFALVRGVEVQDGGATPAEAEGRRLVQAREVEGEVAALFRSGFERVGLDDGRLYASATALLAGPVTSEVWPGGLQRALGSLRRLARALERRPIVVRALGDTPRYGWTGGGDGVLCPYCKDGLAPETGAVVACEDCGTVHHAECFEASGCTVFGCGSARAAARAAPRALTKEA